MFRQLHCVFRPPIASHAPLLLENHALCPRLRRGQPTPILQYLPAPASRLFDSRQVSCYCLLATPPDASRACQADAPKGVPRVLQPTIPLLALWYAAAGAAGALSLSALCLGLGFKVPSFRFPPCVPQRQPAAPRQATAPSPRGRRCWLPMRLPRRRRRRRRHGHWTICCRPYRGRPGRWMGPSRQARAQSANSSL